MEFARTYSEKAILGLSERRFLRGIGLGLGKDRHLLVANGSRLSILDVIYDRLASGLDCL